ncbi:MAG: META domain-containing protein [Pseudomonadota bacterium]
MTAAFLGWILIFTGITPDETLAGYTAQGATYVLSEIDGTPFDARASVSFPGEGRIVVRGPCNMFEARIGVPYPWFSLDPVRTTRRACPELAQEAAFLAALSDMTLAEVGPGLLLLSDDGTGHMIFVQSGE